MNETQRQAYLRAMGIQAYFPRVPVTGAKPSPQYEYEVVVADAPITAATTAVADSGTDGKTTTDSARPASPLARPATPARRREAAPTAAAQSPVADAVPAATDAAAESELRFHLNYYRLSDTLAVIDEVPHRQAQSDQGMVTALLAAIVRALGVEDVVTNLRGETFNWPLETGIAMRNDPVREARNALQGFIAMRQQTDGFKHLIVFAAQVTEVLLPGLTETDRDQVMGNGAYHMTTTHSLQSMLAYPILKREVWAHLQPLRNRLKSPIH